MLGAFALGHLSASEEADVRSHLAGCAECRRQLAEIAPVAAALRSVDPSWLSEAATTPPDLGERIVTAVASERRQRERETLRRRFMLAAAAVLAVLMVGGLGVLIGNRTATTPTAGPTVPIEPVALTSRVSSVEASAGVVAHTWGVEIKLEAVGLRSGASYTAVVETTDGRRRSAGAFVGTGEVTMNCNLNSDVLRPDAAAFEVLDSKGRTVLTADL
jgi:anti-sigma factor RsiW